MTPARLTAFALGLQILGTVCLLLDSIRTAARLPKEGVRLGDPGVFASPIFTWANVVGFGLLFAGFVLQGLALWRARSTRSTTEVEVLAPASPGPPSPEDREELKLLYEVSVTDLAFFKQQQWVATNYGVALYVALVAIASQLLRKPLATSYQILLSLLALAVLVGALGVLCQLQRSIELRRGRLEKVREHFGTAFHAARAVMPKREDTLLRLLVAVLVAGFAVTCWLVTFEI